MADDAGNSEEQGPQLNIIMPPDQMGGVWANFAIVRHSEHEFTLDFIRMDGMGSGIVVARVGDCRRVRPPAHLGARPG